MSYRFKPDIIEPEYPERIKQIIEEYEAHGFEWKPDPDEDMETYKEWKYEGFAKARPETVITDILTIYRLKDEYSQKEWLLYKLKKIARDKADRDYSATVWMGKRPRFNTEPQLDDEGNVINKRITRRKMEYTIPWDPKEFDNVTKITPRKNLALYIAFTSTEYNQNHSGTPIRIKEQNLFRDYSYEELVAHDRKKERERLARETPITTSKTK